MQLKMFSIPAQGPDATVEEMNKFLRAHRVTSLDRRLVEGPGGAYWAICVEYLESGVLPASGTGRPRVDYKEVLSDTDFAVFAKLRDVRKARAEKEGVPPYTVFTNEQLAALVTGKVDSLAAMGRIDGIGKARLEKYGAEFLAALNEARPAAPQAASAKEAAK